MRRARLGVGAFRFLRAHTHLFPEGERPEVVIQLQRAAASIPCNIAEGGRKVVCGREPCRLVTGITQLRRVRRWRSLSSCWQRSPVWRDAAPPAAVFTRRVFFSYPTVVTTACSSTTLRSVPARAPAWCWGRASSPRQGRL